MARGNVYKNTRDTRNMIGCSTKVHHENGTVPTSAARGPQGAMRNASDSGTFKWRCRGDQSWD